MGYAAEDSMNLKEFQTSVNTCRGLAPGTALRRAGHSHKEDLGYEDLCPVITTIPSGIKGRIKGEAKLEELRKSFSNAKYPIGLFSVADRSRLKL
jgi:hypothetical protein